MFKMVQRRKILIQNHSKVVMISVFFSVPKLSICGGFPCALLQSPHSIFSAPAANKSENCVLRLNGAENLDLAGMSTWYPSRQGMYAEQLQVLIIRDAGGGVTCCRIHLPKTAMHRRTSIQARYPWPVMPGPGFTLLKLCYNWHSPASFSNSFPAQKCAPAVFLSQLGGKKDFYRRGD